MSLEDHRVTFRWRDFRHGNKQRRMTLSVHEFLRRFLLHVLSMGFVRIRYFGLLAHRRRKELLPVCVQLLEASVPPISAAVAVSDAPHPPMWTCPV